MPGEFGVACAAHIEFYGIHTIWNDAHLRRVDTAADDFVAESFADRRHSIRMSEDPGFKAARQTIAPARSGSDTMIYGPILPQRSHLVHDGNTEAPPRPYRSKAGQTWRVGMQYVG